MKVLMLNGNPRRGGNTSIALAEMEKVFAKREPFHITNFVR